MSIIINDFKIVFLIEMFSLEFQKRENHMCPEYIKRAIHSLEIINHLVGNSFPFLFPL